jgi:DNA-binding response OmpR family regulator
MMRRILLVDDEEMLRQVLVEVLEDEGYTVLEAKHGGEALRILAAEPVDLIVMDVMMPVMTGIEVVEELRTRSEDNHPPIILMSAGRVVDVARLKISFLRKPFDLAELLTRVSAVLAGGDRT